MSSGIVYFSSYFQKRLGLAKRLNANVLDQGLEMTRNDAWCVHSMAHVHEMKGEVDKGLKFLETTETDWQVCSPPSPFVHRFLLLILI